MSQKFESGVYVADVIMGGGKSSAAINYINQSGDDEKFVVLVLYKSEFERFRSACESKHMITPSESRRSKLFDLGLALQAGKNIVSSHALLERYTPAMLDHIRDRKYTLFIDELYNIIRPLSPACVRDIQYLINCGLAEVDENSCAVTYVGEDDLTGTSMSGTVGMLNQGSIVYTGGQFMIWTLPKEILLAFKSVVVLTYMFRGSPMEGYFKMLGIEYETIGTKKTDMGFEFCPTEESGSARPEVLSKMHIVEDERLNAIGERDRALCASWYQRHKLDGKVDQVRKNIRSALQTEFKCKASDFIYAIYKAALPIISKDKNLKARYVPWNIRATNDYANCHYLAFMVNLFKMPVETQCLAHFGCAPDVDTWALSNMVQCIWRTAIRNGEDVWVYVPSRRMRELLKAWKYNNLLDNISNCEII